MKIVLPNLPYEYDALSPHVSADTLRFHHDKHHRAYVDKARELTEGTQFEGMEVEDIIAEIGGQAEHQKLFNQIAQVWNHTFYWNCMSLNGGGQPSGDAADAIARDFGGYDEFRKQFKQAGVDQFGSGYVWLVSDGGTLKVRSTPDALTPLVDRQFVLLTSDVWEHSYYLDYQNRRDDYLDRFLDRLVNWRFVAENFERMQRSRNPIDAGRMAA